MTSALFNQVVHLLLSPETDADTPVDGYGNPVPGEPRRREHAAYWEPRESGESTDARNQITSGLWLALEGYPDLDALDAVEIDGKRYQVEGEPGRVPGGFTFAGYTKVAVKRVTG